jgi:LacI family transcriptional regulator
MSTTIREVARKAKVSTATVSRVFNASAPVDDATRRRVLAVASDLKYTPNAIGRSLSIRKTEAIGLLLPDLYGEFFSEVIRGSDQATQRMKYHLFVSSSHNHREEIETALRMMRGRVDGLIVMSPHLGAETLMTNIPRGLPVVLLNCSTHDPSIDSINIDNFDGAFQLVSHLIGHGHKKIAMIRGTDQNFDAEERVRGYRAAMKDARIPVSLMIEEHGDFSETSGFESMNAILARSDRPTAVFASNDAMAIGALSAVRDAGLRVPEDMALGGFDDIPIAQFIKPSLSSVSVRISEMGAMAVERLIDAIRKKDDHVRKQIVLPTTVIARESCGCSIAGFSGSQAFRKRAGAVG